MKNHKKPRTAVENVISKLLNRGTEARDNKYNLVGSKIVVESGMVIDVKQDDDMLYCVAIDEGKIENEIYRKGNEIAELCRLVVREYLKG